MREKLANQGCQRYKEHYYKTERSFTKACRVRTLFKPRLSENAQLEVIRYFEKKLLFLAKN
jgi:hypothetical protein